jgi:hypothetical protein
MAKTQATKTKPAGTVAANTTAPQKGAVETGKAAESSSELQEVTPELQRLRANFDDFDKQLEKFAQLNDEEFGKLQQPIAKTGTELTDGVLRAIAAKRKHFTTHIAMFWEIKQRLTLAARWRSDLPGNENRTAETNQKHFGAADWSQYCEKYVAYSLSAADKKLAAFEETTKPTGGDGGTQNEGGTENDGSTSGESEDGSQPKSASIEELGIKIARDLVRIATVLDPAAAMVALQDLVKEAQHLLSRLGKAPEVTGNIDTTPKQAAINGTTSSVLAKGKDA